MCVQRRFKSVCESTHSDQSLSFPPEETLIPLQPKERPSKILIRLRRCAGWSESPMCANANLCILLETGSVKVLCDNNQCEIRLSNVWYLTKWRLEKTDDNDKKSRGILVLTSYCRATRPRRACADAQIRQSPRCLHTQSHDRWRWSLRPSFRPVVKIYTSGWALKWGFCAYAIRTKLHVQ